LAVLAIAAVPGNTEAGQGGHHGHYGGHNYGHYGRHYHDHGGHHDDHHGSHYYGYHLYGSGIHYLGHQAYGHYYGSHDYYYPYGYSYSNRRYHYYPDYGSYSYRPSSHDDYADDSHETDTAYTSTRRATDANTGWALLKSGASRDALNVFAQQAGNDAKNGTPKVGYALASAASGDLERGVWAMRRALRIDPDALHYLSAESDLHAVINSVIADYRASEEHLRSHNDAAFMRASLYYLQHDTEAARYALPDNDDLPSTHNLEHLIDQAAPAP